MRKILKAMVGTLTIINITFCSFTNVSFAYDMHGFNDNTVVQQNVQEQYAESGRTSISKPDMEELRTLYNSLPTYDNLYKTEPVVEGEDYHIAVLSDEAYETAQSQINYYRRVAGLGEITLDDELNKSAAYGALALAMNNTGLTHYPSQPEHMSIEDFNEARFATTSSNLSSAYGFSEKSIISVAISGQIADKSDSNISTVGHRRWLLNPGVKTLGIGSADNNENYYTDVRVFGSDVQSENVNDYDFIAWPASGANLTDTFTSNTPWSVTLNPNVYSTPSYDQVSVEIKSLRYGTTWYFDKDTGQSKSSDENYFTIQTSRYGVPNCIIFRPAYQNIDMFKGDYIVTINNVSRRDSGYTSIQYKVTFDDYAGTTSINDCDISLAQDSYEYEGQEIEPEVIVKDKFTGKILEKDTDYTVSYYYNDKVGTAEAYVRGINKYAYRSVVYYEIKPGNAQLSADIDKKDMKVGEYAQITVNSKAHEFQYTSDNTSVATVSDYGYVYGISEGTANITVSVTDSNYKPEQVTLQVTVSKKQIAIMGILLNTYEETLTEGDTTVLIATVYPEDTTYSKSVSWSSNNEAVATVSADGTVTAKSAGTAIIAATSENGKTAVCKITVNKKQIAITEVRLNKSEETLTEGDTTKLTATVLPDDTTYSKNVSWSSSNEAVATVSADGTVTAKGAGTAVITAISENGKTASCTITVNEKQIPITEVRLNKSAATLVEGETTTLIVTIIPENTTNLKRISWRSSNEEVAVVSLDGTVTAKGAGTAVITAISENGKTASCTITVNKKDTYTGIKEDGGNLIYYKNGAIDTTYTGFAEYKGNKYYVIDGKVDSTYTNVTYDGKDWLYVENGKVRNDYTGIRPNENGWWRIEEGKVNFDYNGLAENENGWWKISGGQVDFGYNDLCYDQTYGWWKVSGGQVDFGYNDLYYSPTLGWWKVSGGSVDFGYTDLYYSPTLGWWKVSGGAVDFGYTDLYYSPTCGWWKVSGGAVDFGYTDLYYSPTCGWWKINGGAVDFDYNGMYNSPTYGSWKIAGGSVVFN